MELALGTVQFGLAYGIAGRGESVPPAEVRRILEIAHASGIRMLDTAAAYGDIEQRLASLCTGLRFSIVSKVPAVPTDLAAGEAARWASASVEQSRARLGEALASILFHRSDDLKGPRGQVLWDAAEAATSSHRLKLGVSCYGPDELQSLSQSFPIQVAQLPGNVLDQRVAVAAERGALGSTEVHMRSAFLQGLLLMPLAQVQQRVPAAAQAIGRWQLWCSERGVPPLQAALAVAKGMAGVRYVVVGVDRPEQLEEILRVWDAASPARADDLASHDLAVIDPRLWRTS